MTTTTKHTAGHTPIPWRIFGDCQIEASGVILAEAVHCTHYPRSRDEDLANARFIVTAVNSHQALLDACKAAMGALQGQPSMADIHHLEAQLQAAIALVEKGME